MRSFLALLSSRLAWARGGPFTLRGPGSSCQAQMPPFQGFLADALDSAHPPFAPQHVDSTRQRLVRLRVQGRVPGHRGASSFARDQRTCADATARRSPSRKCCRAQSTMVRWEELAQDGTPAEPACATQSRNTSNARSHSCSKRDTPISSSTSLSRCASSPLSRASDTLSRSWTRSPGPSLTLDATRTQRTSFSRLHDP